MTLLLLLLLSCWTVISSVRAQDYNISKSNSLDVAPDAPPAKGERNLVQLHILIRHGMRAPDQSFPTNPNPDTVWREGLGQLTQHGKYQQYALGQQLRWMYRHFITSSPIELEVLSSQKPRCTLSALCNVAALLKPDPDDKWEFVPGFAWQPFPVLYATHGPDRYLGKVYLCPKGEKDEKKTVHSNEGQKFIKENKELFDYWSYNSHLSIKTWSDVATLYDILNMHKRYNHLIPDWATKHWDKLQNITSMNFYFASKSKEYQRLRAAPLLEMMRSKMDTRIRGKSKKKVHMYSAHSKTLVAMLSSLGVFNLREPPFCASLIIELYRESETHSIRLLYLNSTTPENGDQVPHMLKLPNCGEYCPYQKFSQLVDELVPLDWEEECHE